MTEKMTETEMLYGLLVSQGKRLWSAAMNGSLSGVPEQKAAWRQMANPSIGDFVMVIMVGPRAVTTQRIGVLRDVELRVSGAPVDFTIELLDGTKLRWESAQAIRLFPSEYDSGPPNVTAPPAA